MNVSIHSILNEIVNDIAAKQQKVVEEADATILAVKPSGNDPMENTADALTKTEIALGNGFRKAHQAVADFIKPEARVYTDDSGNPRAYNNGKLVPVVTTGTDGTPWVNEYNPETGITSLTQGELSATDKARLALANGIESAGQYASDHPFIAAGIPAALATGAGALYLRKKLKEAKKA